MQKSNLIKKRKRMLILTMFVVLVYANCTIALSPSPNSQLADEENLTEGQELTNLSRLAKLRALGQLD